MPAIRTLPRKPYNGITILLDKGSRFDKYNLCGGIAGNYLREALLPYNLDHCDRQTLIAKAKLLPNTKLVFLMGERVLERVGKYNLYQNRGTPFKQDGVIYIPTFPCQECMDVRDYELGELGKIPDEKQEDEKDRSKTARSNFRFWMFKDIAKGLRLLADPKPRTRLEVFNIRPTLEDALQYLRSGGERCYFDIETHPSGTLQCFSVAIDEGMVYAIPIYNYHNSLHYGELGTYKILQTLASCLNKMSVVVHNSNFDLPFLFNEYRIPFGKKIEDTMVINNRIFPEAEKSLAHCISLWTDYPYHKGEGIFDPHTFNEEEQLLRYNARDVHRMRDVLKYQYEYAQPDPGMVNSIEQAKKSLYPLLVASLTGIEIDTDALEVKRKELELYLKQYKRIAEILCGFDINLASSKQLGEYLIGRCGYKAVKLSSSGKTSVDHESLTKLGRTYSNPIIRLAIAYKAKQKQLGFIKL